MKQTEKFWDRIAHRYAKRPIADEAAYQKKLEVTQGYLQPDMQALEFGCGTGKTAIIHAPHVKHILAIDISSKMLSIAKDHAAAEKVENVTFEQNTIENIELQDESFDAVLGLSILHLLDDQEAMIAKIHRILKPGGIFVSSTACIGDMNPIIRAILPLGRLVGLIPFVHVFTTDDLRRRLIDGNLQIEHEWQPGKGKAVFIVARKAG